MVEGQRCDVSNLNSFFFYFIQSLCNSYACKIYKCNRWKPYLSPRAPGTSMLSVTSRWVKDEADRNGDEGILDSLSGGLDDLVHEVEEDSLR